MGRAGQPHTTAFVCLLCLVYNFVLGRYLLASKKHTNSMHCAPFSHYKRYVQSSRRLCLSPLCLSACLRMPPPCLISPLPRPKIIWTMIFHLVRFSLFMFVVMASFALAFYSLYSSCTGDLNLTYGTFSTSLLAMFNAMLGGKSIE